MWVRTVQIRRVEVALNDEQPRENGQEGKGMTWSEAGDLLSTQQTREGIRCRLSGSVTDRKHRRGESVSRNASVVAALEKTGSACVWRTRYAAGESQGCIQIFISILREFLVVLP